MVNSFLASLPCIILFDINKEDKLWGSKALTISHFLFELEPVYGIFSLYFINEPKKLFFCKKHNSGIGNDVFIFLQPV